MDGERSARRPFRYHSTMARLCCGTLSRQLNQCGSCRAGYFARLVLAGCGFTQGRSRHRNQAGRASDHSQLLDSDPSTGRRGIVYPS